MKCDECALNATTHVRKCSFRDLETNCARETKKNNNNNEKYIERIKKGEKRKNWLRQIICKCDRERAGNK